MKRLIPIACLVLLVGLCGPAAAAAPDIVGGPPGWDREESRVPVGPIVGTAAAGGFAAWLLALLRRKKRAKAAEPRAEEPPSEPATA